MLEVLCELRCVWRMWRTARRVQIGCLPSWGRELASASRGSYVVMMEVRPYLIHIKQSVRPYMAIHESDFTVILFHSLEEKQSGELCYSDQSKEGLNFYFRTVRKPKKKENHSAGTYNYFNHWSHPKFDEIVFEKLVLPLVHLVFAVFWQQEEPFKAKAAKKSFLCKKKLLLHALCTETKFKAANDHQELTTPSELTSEWVDLRNKQGPDSFSFHRGLMCLIKGYWWAPNWTNNVLM